MYRFGRVRAVRRSIIVSSSDFSGPPGKTHATYARRSARLVPTADVPRAKTNACRGIARVVMTSVYVRVRLGRCKSASDRPYRLINRLDRTYGRTTAREINKQKKRVSVRASPRGSRDGRGQCRRRPVAWPARFARTSVLAGARTRGVRGKSLPEKL